jgi:hypothetical protein
MKVMDLINVMKVFGQTRAKAYPLIQTIVNGGGKM